MKRRTKEEILKMTKPELENYFTNIHKTENTYCWQCPDTCTGCYDCEDCNNCKACDNCRNCYFCSNIQYKQYAICNIVYTKKEYEAKIEEINS